MEYEYYLKTIENINFFESVKSLIFFKKIKISKLKGFADPIISKKYIIPE